MYRAIIFDLDGTLLDTLTDLAGAMNKALVELGCPPHAVEAYKRFVGDGVENEAKRCLPKDKLDAATVKRCVELASRNYDRCWMENTRPYPGIPEMLDDLARRKVRMAVLSNKPHEFTTVMVERLLGSWRFEAVLGAGPDVRIKPDPAGALRVARELDVPAAEFLYLGDTNTDMKTAVNAGMFALGALWGFRSARELLEAGARGFAEKPGDVTKFLNSR